MAGTPTNDELNVFSTCQHVADWALLRGDGTDHSSQWGSLCLHLDIDPSDPIKAIGLEEADSFNATLVDWKIAGETPRLSSLSRAKSLGHACRLFCKTDYTHAQIETYEW